MRRWRPWLRILPPRSRMSTLRRRSRRRPSPRSKRRWSRTCEAAVALVPAPLAEVAALPAEPEAAVALVAAAVAAARGAAVAEVPAALANPDAAEAEPGRRGGGAGRAGRLRGGHGGPRASRRGRSGGGRGACRRRGRRSRRGSDGRLQGRQDGRHRRRDVASEICFGEIGQRVAAAEAGGGRSPSRRSPPALVAATLARLTAALSDVGSAARRPAATPCQDDFPSR